MKKTKIQKASCLYLILLLAACLCFPAWGEKAADSVEDTMRSWPFSAEIREPYSSVMDSEGTHEYKNEENDVTFMTGPMPYGLIKDEEEAASAATHFVSGTDLDMQWLRTDSFNDVVCYTFQAMEDGLALRNCYVKIVVSDSGEIWGIASSLPENTDSILREEPDEDFRQPISLNAEYESGMYEATLETRSEEALTGIDYGNEFKSLRIRSSYLDNGTGLYAKVGFIARPFDGFRIGAAIQTPTLITVRETYQLEASSVAENKPMSQSSPTDEWFFNVIAPWHANVGVAYTIGQFGLVSADYEYTDYRSMRLSAAYDDNYYYDFSDANLDIKDFTGPVHALRLGAEIKPAPALALRVGYNLTTGAQYNTLQGLDRVVSLTSDERKAQLRTAVSFGVGYSSPRSFFADFAVRFQYLPNEYFTPYWYYYTDNGKSYVDDSVVTPEICGQSALCNALLTLGWRF